MPNPPNNHDHSRLGRWALDLYQRHAIRVRLTLTRNKRSMIRLRQEAPTLFDLRLHRAFERAPDTVLQDLGKHLVHRDPNAWARVKAFAQIIPTLDPPPPPAPKRIILYPCGKIHHLAPILEEVKAEYFNPDLDAHITWGRAPRRRSRGPRRSIRFASWNEEQRVIRVHPALDQSWVPLEFLRYLVYHELCHAVAKPTEGGGGKRRIHHPEFRHLEAQYPQFEKMERLGEQIFQKIRSQGH